MSFDLYVTADGESQQDVDTLVNGNHHGLQITNIVTRIRLLAGIAACNEKVKGYAINAGNRKEGGGYKSLIHKKGDARETPYAKELIAPALYQMENLGIIGGAPNLHILPPGSWFLQFTFTLAKPWISKDDDPFYVADSVNPVRKDKVFKVPMMSAASWKGLLRWTAMHMRLVKQREELTPKDFAKERFVQTLLFGDEKGEEPGQTRDFAGFLDGLLPDEKAKEARTEYERLLRQHYILKGNEPLRHHSGRLMFYPTFFDLIDVEVINPHKRETKAGTHPIYLECVPEKARGTFSLLYVPFDLIGRDEAKIHSQAVNDLRLVTEAVDAMMLTYGFSAKRSSGYGVARDEIGGGIIWTRTGKMCITRLSQLPEEVRNVEF